MGLAASALALFTCLAACESAEDEPEQGDSTDPNYAGSYTIMNASTGTEVTVTVEGGVRSIVANGLPNHTTGDFPNGQNPNSSVLRSTRTHLPPGPPSP